MRYIRQDGKRVKMQGNQLRRGQKAPFFSLKNIASQDVTLESFKGQKVLINVLPDIDSTASEKQVARMFVYGANNDDFHVLNILNKENDEQLYWKERYGIKAEFYYDTDYQLVKSFGIYVPDIHKPARALFLIDESGKLAYSEIVKEITSEPNYAEVLNALNA